MEENSKVKMKDEMSQKAMQLLNQMALANIKFQAYIEGCKNGLGLEGDWDFQTADMSFNKIVKDEAQKVEVTEEER